MLTLIVCLFLDFIYVQYKKKKKPKQKYIVNKTNKDEKKKIIKYIESQYIPFNLLKMKIELDYKKKKRVWNGWEKKKRMRWNEGEKKWTEGALSGSYIAIFSDDFPERTIK